MAAIAFDPLEYTHELEAVGVPREQAEIHARAMTDRFIHNFDALVTNDYLDTRLAVSSAQVDKRFTESDARMDKHFAESDARMDKRFIESEARIDKRFAEVDNRFVALEANMESNFSKVYLMFGLTITTATIPILQNFFGA